MKIEDVKKGMRVTVETEVQFRYVDHLTRPNYKSLVRVDPIEPHKRGIVIGVSIRSTGTRHSGYDQYEPAYLNVDKQYTVIVIEPLGNGRKYLLPFVALPEDVEPFGRNNDS